MIYTTLTEHTFAHELSSNKENGFTYEWACALYNYLEEFGDKIEFDAVAFRCDWDDLEGSEILKQYNNYLEDNEELEDDEERIDYILDRLRENTTVIEHDEGWVVQIH